MNWNQFWLIWCKLHRITVEICVTRNFLILNVIFFWQYICTSSCGKNYTSVIIKKKMALFKVVKGVNACVIFWIVGSNRRHFIPSMIGPFLKVTLVPEKELRVATLPIFYDMIQCEQNTSGNFVMVCWFWIIIFAFSSYDWNESFIPDT